MKKCFYSSAIIFLILTVQLIYANGVIDKDSTAYLSNTVVIKFKNTSSSIIGKQVSLSTAAALMLEPYGVKSAKKLLSNETKFKSSINNIVVIEYFNDMDPVQLSSKLKTLDEVEWAEPRYLREVSYIPNDTLISNQYALTKINAAAAWDISKGDSSIIIGIVDTGVDWDHPDLYANIWVNPGEIPGDGIDNDNNGYVDDIRGWDFGGLTGTADNNPMEDGSYHGTHVAGLASAVTNNTTGIASIGFNCTIMPVKAAQDNLKNSSGQPYISYGDEGIAYAVDNGARIINCSYGGSGYSRLDQELVNYAVENNVLIVAAAGNENSPDAHYPSGYDGVLSVAASDADDKRASFSNYGTTVDVSAPGVATYSTWMNDTYRNLSGTSMASPITAGLAGLVASHFPNYTPGQIAEQIRINTDNIDNLNTGYTKMLGKGRINAYKALSNTNSVAVRATDYDFSDAAPGGNGNGVIAAGETITIYVKFKNYLNPTSSLTITLESLNSSAVVQNGTFTAGALSTLQEIDNSSAKFTAYLPDTIASNAELLFSLNYSDGTYSDFQLFGTTVNPTYATQSGNNVSLTITSNGSLGFNDYPSNLQGEGFHYLDGENILFEGALMIANGTTVSDAARNSGGNKRNYDFTESESFKLKIPGEEADQQGKTIFSDAGAVANKIITLQSYSNNNEADANYILLKYNIKNSSGIEMTDMYAGIFFDWDMVEGSGDNDITAYDSTGNFAYVYHVGGNPDNYAGTAVVSPAEPAFYGILNDGSDGGFSVYDGFSDAEKLKAMSSGISKDSAGPGDISHVISTGPFSISYPGSYDIAFVIAAAPDLEQLRTAVSNARARYNDISDIEFKPELPRIYSLKQNYPNPFNPATTIQFSIAEKGYVTLKIYDILGREVASLVNEEKDAGEYKINFNASNYSSGVYFYEIKSGSFSKSKKMLLLK